jgi:hypothetical protein
MNVYMNIFLLLYADDTVLMTETPEDLQKQLNIFHDYCLAWKLKANIDFSGFRTLLWSFYQQVF